VPMEDRSLTVAAPIRATTVREWIRAMERNYAVRELVRVPGSLGCDGF
jgi:hypothetical protein